MQIKVKHWSEIDPAEWPWRNFTPDEIACKGTGRLLIKHAAMHALQIARDTVSKPFVINSAYRSPRYNAKIGGVKNSYHTKGMAFDISLRGHDKHQLVNELVAAGFRGIGHYPTFIHADIRPSDHAVHFYRD